MSLKTYVLPDILSRIWPLCFKCVAREDVIIRACLVCGRHSWSVSFIWAPFLKRFQSWTSLFKFVAYFDVNLDVCPIWTSLFEHVSYVDVILEVSRLFPLHAWTVPHLDVIIQVCRVLWHQSWRLSHLDVIIRACLVCGGHSWSMSLIRAPFLNRFSFGHHYPSLSRIWTLFLKYIAYSGSIIEPFLIWTSLFKFVAHLDLILEVCRDIQKNENGSLTLCMVAFIIPLQVYPYLYVYFMQMNVKAEKTCQILEKAFGKYVFRGSTSFHSCWMGIGILLFITHGAPINTNF